MTTNSFPNLDFLGFYLDTFVSECRAGGLVDSAEFAIPTNAQIRELEAYLDIKGYKLRYKTTANSAYLSYPTRTHESVGKNLGYFIATCYEARTFDNNMPMRDFGTADQHLTNRSYQPDLCTQVLNRTHQSANFVEETHYRCGKTMEHFHQRLRNFILDTPNIMLVLGIKIYLFDGHGQFAAIAILYERTPLNQPQITHNISFGSLAPEATDVNEWQAETNGFPLTGVGAPGFLPCNAANINSPAYILPLRQDLMLCRNSVPPFIYNPGVEDMPDAVGTFNYRLYPLQRQIFESILN